MLIYVKSELWLEN